MKILYVNKVSPRLGGGAELRLLEVGKRLVAKGHSVHVVCSKTEPGLPGYEEVQGICVHYVKLVPETLFRFKRVSFYLSRYLFYILSYTFGNLIRKISPDIIVDDVSPSPSFAYLSAQRSNIPFCAIIHEYFGNHWFQLNDPLTALLGMISQVLLHRLTYDKIITVSQYTYEELEKAGFLPEMIEVIPNGIDLEMYTLENPPERKPNWLLVVGRLVPQKGHRYLLEALTYVRKQVPNVRLHIIGDGPLRVDLERYVAQTGLEDNVVFFGHVTLQTKIEFLWRSSIFTMPSLQEGFGIVLLEAMACGLSVVAFDLPVYQELLDPDCGSLVPKLDVRAMAVQTVRLLHDNEVRERVSAHNLIHVRQFGWDSVADAEERVLLNVVANRTGDKLPQQK